MAPGPEVHSGTSWDTSWDTLVISDLDVIEFECALGPSRELLWEPFGHKFVILEVEIDVGTRKLFAKRF